MALQPSCHGTKPPISPASPSCQSKKSKCICFTLALRAFSAVVFRGQMQCMWHRERISITDKLEGEWPIVPSSLRTQRRFLFQRLSLFILQSCCPENTDDRSFGHKQPKTGHFCCLSLFVFQLLRLPAFKSSAYTLYYYVCLPLTYQKANNIN